jgi:hypothetical protein
MDDRVASLMLLREARRLTGATAAQKTADGGQRRCAALLDRPVASLSCAQSFSVCVFLSVAWVRLFLQRKVVLIEREDIMFQRLLECKGKVVAVEGWHISTGSRHGELTAPVHSLQENRLASVHDNLAISSQVLGPTTSERSLPRELHIPHKVRPVSLFMRSAAVLRLSDLLLLALLLVAAASRGALAVPPTGATSSSFTFSFNLPACTSKRPPTDDSTYACVPAVCFPCHT